MMPRNRPPIAILVIYDLGYKFRYSKYYLGLGNNTIGSHSQCTVRINDSQVPQKVANIQISNDLAILEPLSNLSVYVPSNMKKKNFVAPISVGVRYVIQMEKDFVICGRKVLMQVSPYDQLKRVKGVVNQNLFLISSQQSSQVNGSQQNSQNKKIQQQRVFSQKFQSTLPLQQINYFEPTLPIDEADCFMPTQVMENDYGVFQSTLPLQDTITVPPYRNNSTSQNKQNSQSVQNSQNNQNSPTKTESVHSSLRKSQNQQRGSDPSMSLSMPSTIKQGESPSDQMPPTIKDEQMFPPTLQDDNFSQNKKSPVGKMTKSTPVYRAQKQMKRNSQQKQKQKQKQKVKEIEDQRNNASSFDDIFGISSYEPKKPVHSHSASEKKVEQKKQLQIKQTISENESEKTQKLPSDEDSGQKLRDMKFSRLKRIKQEQKQDIIPSQLSLKKCCLLGKSSRKQTQIAQLLKNKGYQLTKQDSITNQNIKDIALILIEGQPKISKVLMLALIHGKQIKPFNYLTNPLASIPSKQKIQGFIWQQIDKRKGKGKGIFPSAIIFYLQNELKDDFQQPLIAAGASLIDPIGRSKAKKQITLILDEKSQEGKQLYEQYKGYKNWGFVSKKMIIQSVLMGQQILEKYRLDAYSF